MTRSWRVAGAVLLTPFLLIGSQGGLAASASSPPSAVVGAAHRAADAIRDQFDASRVPAAAFAVLDGDDVVMGARGDGVDEHTPFVLGSVSKSFTALAVAQLVDRGQVDVDAPVARYVPGFTTRTAGADITVRQLLTQTSGLPTSAGLDAVQHPERPLADRVAGAAEVLRSSPPGTRFEYSNLNYAILGRLVELVSGKPFAAYVQEDIFAPLGMTDSRTSIGSARADGLPSGSFAWFGLDVRLAPRPAPGVLPDGYLVSSASDMARYLTMQGGDGTYRGVRLVSRKGLALMHTAQVRTPAGAAAASTDHYGFGWATGRVRGHRLLAHDGDVPGYHANVALLPDDGKALVVLVARNGFFSDADAGYLAGLAVLSGGDVAAPSRAFNHAAVAITAASLLVLGRLVASFPGRRRRVRSQGRSCSRRGLLLAGGDALLAGAVLAAVFGGVGMAVQGSLLSPGLAFSSAPDVTTVVLAAVTLLLTRGIATLVWSQIHVRPPRRGPRVALLPAETCLARVTLMPPVLATDSIKVDEPRRDLSRKRRGSLPVG